MLRRGGSEWETHSTRKHLTGNNKNMSVNSNGKTRYQSSLCDKLESLVEPGRGSEKHTGSLVKLSECLRDLDRSTCICFGLMLLITLDVK